MSVARRKILELFEGADRPLSAREVFNTFVTQACTTSLPTVYRAIQELERRELLVREWSDGGRELVFLPSAACPPKTGPRIRCHLCFRTWPLADAGLASEVAGSLAGLAVSGSENTFIVQIECAACESRAGEPTGACTGNG